LQRKIAAILSAYDGLMGNNMRRIAILEEMARALYHEWFVNFRFPGDERARIVESEIGPIPEGWQVRRASEILEVDPRTPVSADGQKAFVAMSALSEHSMVIGAIEQKAGNAGTKFKNGDTLFARITPCLENGKTAFVQFLASPDEVALGSTEFIVLRSKTVCAEFVYLLARSAAFRENAIKSMTGATGRQRVQTECFEKFLIAEPEQATMNAFREQVAPIFSIVQTLIAKNSNLRQTRDLLLPKFVLGEIDVSDLDIRVPEAAE
jgi:type I restriction enzyme S subunit